jgi:hypothetical protein
VSVALVSPERRGSRDVSVTGKLHFSIQLPFLFDAFGGVSDVPLTTICAFMTVVGIWEIAAQIWQLALVWKKEFHYRRTNRRQPSRTVALFKKAIGVVVREAMKFKFSAEITFRRSGSGATTLL